jgi:DASS family divalent anion:Na+ symporter
MQGIEKTGLGKRVANHFVKALGHSTLGLTYGLNVAESVLAPAMPSTSARAGGVIVPIIRSLAEQSGSLPGIQKETVCFVGKSWNSLRLD